MWQKIEEFPSYEIAPDGTVRNIETDRKMKPLVNQYGVVFHALVRDGVQYHRSLPLMVAKAYLKQSNEAFDTPINKDGDRSNCDVNNLAWRPRWFAIAYNKQFKQRYEHPILTPIWEPDTEEIYQDSFDVSWKNGLLEVDVVLAVLNKTYVWPTYQVFELQ